MVFFGTSENNNMFSFSIHTGPSLHSYPSDKISTVAEGLMIASSAGSSFSIDPMVLTSLATLQETKLTLTKTAIRIFFITDLQVREVKKIHESLIRGRSHHKAGT